MFIKTLVQQSRISVFKLTYLLFFSVFLVFVAIFGVYINSVKACYSNTYFCNDYYGDPAPSDKCVCPFTQNVDGATCETNICPAPCGQVASGTYGSIGGSCSPLQYTDSYGNLITDPNVCGGNWCMRWFYCCTICGPGDCGTEGGEEECTCTAWGYSGSCGEGGCGATQRPQTRECTPDLCSSESRCVDEDDCSDPCTYDMSSWSCGIDFATDPCGDNQLASYAINESPADCMGNYWECGDLNPDPKCLPTPTPVVGCVLSFSGSTSVDLGLTEDVIIGNSGDPAAIVTLTSNNPSAVTVCGSATTPCPSGQASFTYNPAQFLFHITGVSENSYSLEVSGYEADGTPCIGLMISNDPPNDPSLGPWFQFAGGSVMSGGSIDSNVASGLYLMAGGVLGNSHGLPIVGGTVSHLPGLLSVGGWKAEGTTYSGTLPSYDVLKSKIPVLMDDTGSSVGESLLTDPARGREYPSGSGYRYFYYDGSSGNLSLNESSDGSIDLGANKVILFAENSEVYINSKITVTDGQGFFMLISKGNVIIWNGVGGANDGVPELEGVYYTDGVFRTSPLLSLSGEQLHIRGVVIGKTGVSPVREASDDLFPSEIFEFGPDQSVLIPGIFSRRAINWKEVLPK